MISEIKKFFKDNEGDIVLIIGVILIALVSFYLGRISASSWDNQGKVGESEGSALVQDIPIESMEANVGEIQKSDPNNENKQDIIPYQEKNFSGVEGEEVEDETKDSVKIKEDIEGPDEQKSQIVASKNGEAYHYIWCPGAKRIKDENKIYFNSKEEAEKVGYRPAKNCPGL